MLQEAIALKLKSKPFLQRNSEEERFRLRRKFESVRKVRLKLEKRKNASAFERNVGYPVVMLLLVALTGFALCLVSDFFRRLFGRHDLILNIATFSVYIT